MILGHVCHSSLTVVHIKTFEYLCHVFCYVQVKNVAEALLHTQCEESCNVGYEVRFLVNNRPRTNAFWERLLYSLTQCLH